MTKNKIVSKVILFLALVMVVIFYCIWGILNLIQLPFEWLMMGMIDSGMDYIKELHTDTGPK